MLLKRLRTLALAALLLCAPVLGETALQGFAANKAYQYVQFGAYPQEAAEEALPIVWRVLRVEDGVAYLLSDRILDVRRIHGDQWNYQGFEHSELHAWLQDTFVGEAFTVEEAAALREDPVFGRVSLPDSDDIRDRDAGFTDDRSRYFYGTPYALEQGLYTYRGGGHSPIFTRTRSQRAHANRATKIDGTIGFIGVESDDLGLVPVIWLDTAMVTAEGGSGTLEEPLVLTPAEVAAP